MTNDDHTWHQKLCHFITSHMHFNLLICRTLFNATEIRSHIGMPFLQTQCNLARIYGLFIPNAWIWINKNNIWVKCMKVTPTDPANLIVWYCMLVNKRKSCMWMDMVWLWNKSNYIIVSTCDKQKFFSRIGACLMRLVCKQMERNRWLHHLL